MEINDNRFTLCNIYAPNDDCPYFFTQALETIDSFDNVSKIIAGDFNLVMDVNLDKKGGAPITQFKSKDTLEVYMEQKEVVDI